MRLSKRLILTSIFGCTCIASAQAEGVQRGTKIYTDAHVQFSYPANRYSGVNTGDTLQVYAYFLQIRKEDASDLVTVCLKNIKDCGTNMGMVQPYWYSEDGTLMLFSATTVVKKKKGTGSGETIYEAFPACPATDAEGSSAYAGNCYELVKAKKDRTLSITYWIGPRSLHRSKDQAVKDATKLLESIEMK